MRHILLEKYLSSQFKFGFELEAFYKEGWESEDYEDDIKLNIKEDIANGFKMSEDDIIIKYDGSLEPNYDEDFSFEWATPTLQFNPSTIKQCVEGLDYLMNSGYYTNETCGFHVHLSFPNISDKDVIWIISQLSINPELIYKLTKFEGLDFYDDRYADIDDLFDIQYAIKSSDFSTLKQYFTTDKYKAFHIHPQGTIEWRGPRNFMNYYNINSVKHFFKLLYEFILWISKAISTNDILGISKNNYFQLLYGENYEENNLIKDFNKKEKGKILRKYVHQDVENNSPDRLIKLLKLYKTTNDEKIYQVIFNYLKILDIDYMYENNNFFKKLLTKLIDNQLLYVFFNISYYYTNISLKLFKLSSSEEAFIILEFLLDIDNKTAITKFMSEISNNNRLGAQKFFIKHQDDIGHFYWIDFFKNHTNIINYSAYINNKNNIFEDDLYNFIYKTVIENYHGIGKDIRLLKINKMLDVGKKNNIMFSIYKDIFEKMNKSIIEDERLEEPVKSGMIKLVNKLYRKLTN